MKMQSYTKTCDGEKKRSKNSPSSFLHEGAAAGLFSTRQSQQIASGRKSSQIAPSPKTMYRGTHQPATRHIANSSPT